MTGSLEALLAPQSVAVIGASDEPGRIGGRPIHSMLTGGFAGRIYPVNPRRRTAQGLQCYPDIASVPEQVDCVVVSVPAPVAVEVIADCAKAGARSAIVFTSGFAETGAPGSSAQQQIAGIARTSGMRIVGPNCLGIFNLELGWFGTFANTLASRKLPCGPIGIITQSGAYGSHLFTITQNRGVGSTYWVTTGNECDVDVAEVISCYAAIDSIRVIVAYAEGIGDGERLRQAFADARAARKPVIFMKVGMTEAGARAAASHTASLAGSDSIYDGLFAQYGVWRAETTEEMADIAYAAQFDRYPDGNRISLQTISGGVGVQLADAASRRGFEVAPLPEATRARMLEVIPFGGVNNPVDFTGQALNDRTILDRCMELTVEEGGYHSHIIYVASLPASPFTRDLSLSVFRQLRERYPDELFLMTMIAPEDIRRLYEEMGYPCFEDHSLAVRAMAALRHFNRVFERGAPLPAASLPAGVLPVPGAMAGEQDARDFLASAGIPVVEGARAATADAAVEAWRGIGGPVVLKIDSPDITHKTEIGGVLLDLDDEDAVRRGYATLLDRARTAAPAARIPGVTVSRMVRGGIETVLGVVRDPVFGPVVMFGLGGIFVEVLRDVSFRVAPFGEDEARDMIDAIRGRAVLDGVRGAPPGDVDALARALSRLSVLAAANAATIDSIDVNPFLVLPEGAVAVDALIVPRRD